jgi:hypothetical protein
LEPAITWDRAQIREEHQRLQGFLARLRAETDREVIVALLAELPELLAEHFRHEEQPGGLYEAMGARSHAAPGGELGRLLDDHFRLTLMARHIADEALLPAVPTPTLLEQTTRIADYLLDHESRELAFARAQLTEA